MSSFEKESGVMSHCASCGVKEGGNIKLKICTACKSIRYCGVKCQKEHRSKHKRACKKRAAELRDEILFRQPESCCYGDCPICCLPLPIVEEKSLYMPCCSKVICDGCCFTNMARQIEQKRGQKCPFCRSPAPKSQAEGEKRAKDRADMNDPVALRQLGIRLNERGDYHSAFQYLSKAVELGDLSAQNQLAGMYHEGHSVEKDESKALYHYEQAAICGHPLARLNAGIIEMNNDRYERAAKHWIIASKLGDDNSLDRLKLLYEVGGVSKDDFLTALRAHQAAVDETKSPQRNEAEAQIKRMGYRECV